jgi:hypothetical protein
MTIQSYPYLIASSLASGLISFNYYPLEQAIIHDSTSNSRFPVDQINQECLEITINRMSALSVQPELIIDRGIPARLVSAAIR